MLICPHLQSQCFATERWAQLDLLSVVCTAADVVCRAERVFERQVLPVLQDAAGMTVSSMVTSGPGDATTFVSQMDLEAVDVLLFVGGDGTVYEGLQVREGSAVCSNLAKRSVHACTCHGKVHAKRSALLTRLSSG